MKSKNSNFSKFLLLWSGSLISSIGGGLTSFGLGVYVFQQTGSAAGMALVTLLAFLPTLLFSVPAGVLADRYDRRVLMMIGDGFSGLGILYILICMLQGEAKLYQICIGVLISSIFSALLEPSYRATVTDLLTKEEYSKASGLVNLAGSARYLVSPVLAGILLTFSDISLLLVIDIATFFVTLLATAVVKKGLVSKQLEKRESFSESLKQGWQAVHMRKGVFLLILISSALTFFMGAFQILAEPLILAFKNSATLGVGESICASGMLFSSLFLGIKGLKKNYTRILSNSLLIAGAAMVGFGLRENMFTICIFGFIFFLMLPFANNCLDYLVRTNIPDELQGRAWGFIGFLSQVGYVVSYALAGTLADLIGKMADIGVGRGAAWVIMVAGVFLALIAFTLRFVKSIRELEKSKA